MNVVNLQSDQLEHSDFLSQGVTGVVHGLTFHALGLKVDKGVNLVDCNADGGGGGWPHSHQYLPRLELILKSTLVKRVCMIHKTVEGSPSTRMLK